jgi:AcrR family transcriptional regulator
MGEGRRSELLEATQRVIARDGFASATVGAITREAGASTGLLNYHFPSKDSIVAEAFAALARSDLAELREVAAHPGTPAERLALFVALLDFSETASWRTWVDAWGDSVRADALRRTLERFVRGYRAVLADVLADGDRRGVWSCADPDDAASRLIAALDGIGLHATLHPGDVDAERADAWARRLLEAELGVVLPAPPPVSPGPSTAPAEIETRVAVRLGDVDPRGVVPAATLLAYLREGREAWLRTRFGSGEEPVLLVAHVGLEILVPVRREDGTVLARVVAERTGRSSVRTRETLVTPAGRTAARAEVTLVAWDDDADAPRELTDAEREALGR